MPTCCQLVAAAWPSGVLVAMNRADARRRIPDDCLTDMVLIGGSVQNDGTGGSFYYSASSLAADDDYSVLKPDTVDAASPGRWLRSI